MACKLCKNDRPLLKSHIFPEWLYTPIFDDDEGIFDRITRKSRKRRTRPEVLYHRLLCEECEQRIGEWEGYAHDVFFGDVPGLKVEDLGNRFIISGVNYTPFKLFQMSLIWRASISNRPEVPRINLGPHGERIREMLIEERPEESHKYGSILFFPSMSIQQMTEDFFDPPERATEKFHGHTAYQAIFGGMVWMFIVSNHSEVLPNGLFLSENGRLPFIIIDVPAVESALETARWAIRPLSRHDPPVSGARASCPRIAGDPSMRPRSDDRGNLTGPMTYTMQSTRFNEAAIR